MGRAVLHFGNTVSHAFGARPHEGSTETDLILARSKAKWYAFPRRLRAPFHFNRRRPRTRKSSRLAVLQRARLRKTKPEENSSWPTQQTSTPFWAPGGFSLTFGRCSQPASGTISSAKTRTVTSATLPMVACTRFSRGKTALRRLTPF